MEFMNMTLGEFYEKAQKAVAELENVNDLSLQTFNETAEADLKDAGLLEDPIFLRDGTIYFGIKSLYGEQESTSEDAETEADADTESAEKTTKFDMERELGTIHAAYKDDFHYRSDVKTFPLQTEITQKPDYPLDLSLSDLECQFRLDAANDEKKRIEEELQEMMTKISDYKEKVSVLNEVIAKKGAISE
ncbi:MAG: hypothetical protein ACI4HI_08870 [Lachnospiraceae bacterium]